MIWSAALQADSEQEIIPRVWALQDGNLTPTYRPFVGRRRGRLRCFFRRNDGAEIGRGQRGRKMAGPFRFWLTRWPKD